MCSAPAPISARLPKPRTGTRSISANLPTRRASRSRTRPSIPDSATSPRSTVPPPAAWEEELRERALALAASSDRPAEARGIALPPLDRKIDGDIIAYPHLQVALDRERRLTEVRVLGPSELPADVAGIHAAGAGF